MTDSILKIVTLIIAPLLTGIIGILVFFLTKKNNELTLVKEKLSNKKNETYTEILAIFFDLLKQDKGLGKVDDIKLKERYINIKSNLLLLAPDNIVQKFFELQDSNVTDTSQVFLKYLELIVLIRRNMGNPKTQMTPKKLLKGLVASNKDYDEILLLINKKEINN